MKKIYAIVAAVAALSFTACGNKTQNTAECDSTCNEACICDPCECDPCQCGDECGKECCELTEFCGKALTEAIEAKDATTFQQKVEEAKAFIAKLIEEGKTEEAAKYTEQLKQFIAENKAKIEEFTAAAVVFCIAGRQLAEVCASMEHRLVHLLAAAQVIGQSSRQQVGMTVLSDTRWKVGGFQHHGAKRNELLLNGVKYLGIDQLVTMGRMPDGGIHNVFGVILAHQFRYHFHHFDAAEQAYLDNLWLQVVEDGLNLLPYGGGRQIVELLNAPRVLYRDGRDG